MRSWVVRVQMPGASAWLLGCVCQSQLVNSAEGPIADGLLRGRGRGPLGWWRARLGRALPEVLKHCSPSQCSPLVLSRAAIPGSDA